VSIREFNEEGSSLTVDTKGPRIEGSSKMDIAMGITVDLGMLGISNLVSYRH
jgi:hypothetical protein